MKKLFLFSDTHGAHKVAVKVPECDIAIHAGDVVGHSNLKEIISFLKWYSAQPAKVKILVAGNHDWPFERSGEREICRLLCKENDIIYLEAEGVEIEGYKIWGSPMQPYFCSLAFNRSSDFLKEHWKEIPDDTDILITHHPPFGILDETVAMPPGRHVGCKYLRDRVLDIAPMIHLFGHIHEAYGEFDNGITRFFNASIMDHMYNPVNKPFLISLP